MSNPYIGIDNSARLVKQISIGQSGVARKVLHGYIGVNGVAKLFYNSSIPFTYTYTGDVIENEIVVDGTEYIVLTLTSSGTFTPNRAINIDVWLCGGGGNGGRGSSGAGASHSHYGGGGGGGYVNSSSMEINAPIVCSVGAQGGKSQFGIIAAKPGRTPKYGYDANLGKTVTEGKGGDGGSGGGGSGYYSKSTENGGMGRGAGVTTIPVGFGDDRPHCGGGGGGPYQNTNWLNGGAGGSNGSNGNRSSSSFSTVMRDAAGGAVGGGTGSRTYSSRAATFYGGGGGGAGGNGYQGVVYIRYKKEDAV